MRDRRAREIERSVSSGKAKYQFNFALGVIPDSRASAERAIRYCTRQFPIIAWELGRGAKSGLFAETAR